MNYPAGITGDARTARTDWWDSHKEVVSVSGRVSPPSPIHGGQFDLQQAPKAPLLTRRGSPGAPLVPEKVPLDPDTSGGVPPQLRRAASPAQPSPPYELDAGYAPLIQQSGSSYRPPVPPKERLDLDTSGRVPLQPSRAASPAQPPPPYELEARHAPTIPWSGSPGVPQQPRRAASPAQPSPPYELDAGYAPLIQQSGSSYRPPVPPKERPDLDASGGAQLQPPRTALPAQQPLVYELEAVPASTRQQPTPRMQTSGSASYRRDGPFYEASPEMLAGREGTPPPYRPQAMTFGSRVSTVAPYPVDIDFQEQEREQKLGPVFLSAGLEAFGNNDVRSSPPLRLKEPGRLRGAMSSLRSSVKRLFFPFATRNPDRLKKYE